MMKARLLGTIAVVVGAMMIHIFSLSTSEQVMVVLNLATTDVPSIHRQQHDKGSNRVMLSISNELQKIYQGNNARSNLTLAPSEYLFPGSPLHDKTLPWDSSVPRFWLSSSEAKPPPAMILLTNVGWNQANQTVGSQIYRGMRLRQLMDGIINHEWFHPTAYSDLNEGRTAVSNTTRYYVFVDSDMCGEKNFPKYGRGEYANADRAGRGDCCRSSSTLHIDSVMHSKLLREAPYAKVVVWECGGAGPTAAYNKLRQVYGNKLSLISLSSSREQLRPGIDQGLPPPVVNPCNLTMLERQRIEDCDEEHQNVLVSFSGMIRWTARNSLMKLDNGKDILVFRGKKREVMQHFNVSDFGLAYHMLFKSSLFGACPRGDNLFSYRFAEQMSCGTIPVVYADDWVLPFDFALVDWEDAVVIIREEDADKTPEILRAIPRKTRCVMRRKALEFYEKYFKDGRSVIRSIVETFEVRNKSRPTYTAPVEEQQIYTNNACGAHSSRDNSPLKDNTLCWDSTVDRRWLTNTSNPHPPGILLLTQFGWFHRKPKKRLKRYRSLRTKELVEGIVNHPWFSPQSLTNIFKGNASVHPSVTYYIFLDVETCGESNYSFHQQGLKSNADTFGGRTASTKDINRDQSIWSHLSQLNASISWKVVYWDCGSYGPPKNVDRLGGRTAMASTSARQTQETPKWDQGLPFPPYRRFKLSSVQRDAIESCDDRPVLLYFSGQLLSRPRRLLRRLQNGKDVWIGTPNDMKSWRNQSDSYFELAVESSFCAIPRGARLGSSRLVEMMSAGCIPVILADNWVLPIQLAINWREIAVIVPEIKILETVEILRNITKDAQCKMRKRTLLVYDRYLSTGRGIVAGIVEGLEKAKAANLPVPPAGYNCVTLESGGSECKKVKS